MNDNMKINDKISIKLSQKSQLFNMKSYRVISRAGLIKRGEKYEKDDIVLLDEATAESFIKNKDILAT